MSQEGAVSYERGTPQKARGCAPRSPRPRLLYATRMIGTESTCLVFKAHRLCESLNSRLDSNKEIRSTCISRLPG